jgi:hypothetical protein
VDSQNNIIIDILAGTKKLASVEASLREVHRLVYEKTINELDKLIARFNITTEFKTAINAKFLKSILTDPLPKYEYVISTLLSDPLIKNKVIYEFNNSDYLNNVWKIADNRALYVNFIILVYRTTLLNYHGYLRKMNVQISSSLEEMSALAALEGNKNLVFESTKIWLRDWKNEQFSEQLVNELLLKGIL